MKEEVSGIRRLGTWRPTKAGGCAAFLNEELAGGATLLAVSGMGKEAALNAGRRLLADRGPKVLVSIGFAGALDPGLRPGALLVASRLRPWPDGREGALRPDQTLEQLAHQTAVTLKMPCYAGDWLTVDAVVASAVEKRRLRLETGAVAVEMESWYLAQAAQEAGVPFVAIRTVLDEAGRGLPQVIARSAGRPRALDMAVSVLLRPLDTPSLIGLGRALVLARRSLARFVMPFLELLAKQSALRAYGSG